MNREKTEQKPSNFRKLLDSISPELRVLFMESSGARTIALVADGIRPACEGFVFSPEKDSIVSVATEFDQETMEIINEIVIPLDLPEGTYHAPGMNGPNFYYNLEKVIEVTTRNPDIFPQLESKEDVDNLFSNLNTNAGDPVRSLQVGILLGFPPSAVKEFIKLNRARGLISDLLFMYENNEVKLTEDELDFAQTYDDQSVPTSEISEEKYRNLIRKYFLETTEDEMTYAFHARLAASYWDMSFIMRDNDEDGLVFLKEMKDVVEGSELPEYFLEVD